MLNFDERDLIRFAEDVASFRSVCGSKPR